MENLALSHMLLEFIFYRYNYIWERSSIISSAIEFDFVSNDTLIFLALSTLFSLAVLLHTVLYYLKNYRTLKV